MDFNDAIEQCRTADFGLGMAFRSDADGGWVSPSYVTWESTFSPVSEEPSPHYGQAYVSFESVARGDDSYGQSDCTVRSNYRSLKRDFPDFPWVDVSYMNTNGLGCFVEDLTEEMLEILVGLSVDYPLYDECDHSAVEQEEIDESWDGWLRRELYRHFDSMRPTCGSLQLIWDGLGESAVEDLFWTAVSQDMLGNYPEHRGTEVVWGPVEGIAEAFRPLLVRAFMNKRRGLTGDTYQWVTYDMIKGDRA